MMKVNTARNGQSQATKLEEHGLLNHFITGKKNNSQAKIKSMLRGKATKMLAFQADTSSVTANLS